MTRGRRVLDWRARCVPVPDDCPEDMLAACPMYNAAVGVGGVCARCEYCSGLLMANPDERVAFRDRFQVLCRWPRRIAITPLVDAHEGAD